MRDDTVRDVDPAVADALVSERRRRDGSLALVASENHASEAVVAAQGSALANTGAEGYPGERAGAGAGAGSEHADAVERLARERAAELWGADHVTVQPHSGSQANLAARLALAEPGDRILAPEPTYGGRPSRGHPADVAGGLFEVERYQVDPETGTVDYERLREAAASFDPDVIVSGRSASPREVDFGRVQAVAERVEAAHLADITHVTGLIAAGLHQSPVGVADVVTGSTHETIRAGRGGIVMCGSAHAAAVDEAVSPGLQGGPLMHDVAGTAVGFGEALEPRFADYARQTVANARAMADRFADRGLEVVAGGTDTHRVLVDLRPSHPDTAGTEVVSALDSVGVGLDANAVPGETRSASAPSGIRVETPAITTRGFTEAACREVADLVADVVEAPRDDDLLAAVGARVDALTDEYSLYG
jgi:glycine hydroxymethyltransferase